MKKQALAAISMITVGLIAGCGGGGGSDSGTTTTSTTITGKVADGYLSGAEVFLDKNGNYQWDVNEPKTTTDGNGAYRMTVSTADAATCPVVARAIAGVTIDNDYPNVRITSSYVLCAPAGATGFISPMSTLIREKMLADPNMTLTEAMTQLRNQMHLSADIDMMADYVAGSQSGVNASQHQTMHTAAQQMVSLMAGQSSLVMPDGRSVDVNRYHSMMGTINANMSGIAANVENHLGEHSTFMTTMMTTMQSQLRTISTTSGFMNYSAMFRNMTSSRYFWRTESGTITPMTPMGGGMM
jgi:hypothetical protein